MQNKNTIGSIATHIAKLESDRRYLLLLVVLLGLTECATLIAYFIR
jgi:hypothetical protein